jgi:O-6-methylguanine DNA methyltransferase
VAIGVAHELRGSRRAWHDWRMSVGVLDRASTRSTRPRQSNTLRVDLIESSVGALTVIASERGLRRVAFGDRLEEWAAALPDLTVAPIDEVRAQLGEYFAGERRAFSLDLDLQATGFSRSVLDELARVPYGELETYGALAAAAGYPGAARAVGGVMNRNPIAIVLPCHRIVGADGSLTGFGGGLELKRTLLELEGALLSLA